MTKRWWVIPETFITEPKFVPVIVRRADDVSDDEVRGTGPALAVLHDVGGHVFCATPRGRSALVVHKQMTVLGVGGVGFRPVLRAWTPKGQPDLTQVMFVMSGDLLEFIPQRAHAVDTMHPLKVAAPLIVHTRIVDDGVAHRRIDLPGEVQRHARIVESLRPRILIHHP